MAEIQGQFDIRLTTAIDVSPDFPKSGLSLCQLQINQSKITISPLEIAEITVYPDGEYDSPKITDIRVSIIKELDIVGNIKEELTLSRDAEHIFEEILVEATRQFVTIIKHNTNQWDLDTKNPIDAYNYAYSLGDTRLTTLFPLEPGTMRIPEYAHGRIIFSTQDMHVELSQDIWEKVVAEVSQRVSVPLYDELLSDAKAFRSRIRYDASALYAAIASELMLGKMCRFLLKAKEGLSDKQCESKVVKLRVLGLFKLIQKLNPDLTTNYDDVRELFRLRNKIAHGEILTISPQEASKALRTADQLKNDLSVILKPP